MNQKIYERGFKLEHKELEYKGFKMRLLERQGGDFDLEIFRIGPKAIVANGHGTSILRRKEFGEEYTIESGKRYIESIIGHEKEVLWRVIGILERRKSVKPVQ